jgi:hypothetical protein
LGVRGVFLSAECGTAVGGFKAFGGFDDEVALADVFDVALDFGGAGGASGFAFVGGDAAFFGELGEVGADVAVGGTSEAGVDVGVELEHEVPGGDGAAFGEGFDDLAFAHVAVVDVLLESLAGVVDDFAVPGADDFEVGEFEQALEGASVLAEVPDGGGG